MIRQAEKYNLREFTTDTISVTEAAKIMRVSNGTIRNLLSSGELHGGKFRSVWRVNRALLYQYLIDQTTGQDGD